MTNQKLGYFTQRSIASVADGVRCRPLDSIDNGDTGRAKALDPDQSAFEFPYCTSQPLRYAIKDLVTDLRWLHHTYIARADCLT